MWLYSRAPLIIQCTGHHKPLMTYVYLLVHHTFTVLCLFPRKPLMIQCTGHYKPLMTYVYWLVHHTSTIRCLILCKSLMIQCTVHYKPLMTRVYRLFCLYTTHTHTRTHVIQCQYPCKLYTHDVMNVCCFVVSHSHSSACNVVLTCKPDNIASPHVV